MNTAQDVIAEAIADHLSAGSRAIGDHHTAAGDVVRALLSAPETVRMELAALLNPWRPASTAPIDGNDFQGLFFGDQQMIVFYDEPSADAPTHCWHGADGLAYHKDALSGWAPLLPAPPSEDKT